jgi:hypothetical protein
MMILGPIRGGPFASTGGDWIASRPRQDLRRRNLEKMSFV